MRTLLTLSLCLALCTPAYGEGEPIEEPVQETQTLPEVYTEAEFLELYQPGEDESNTDVPLPVSDVPVTGNVLPQSQLPAKVSGGVSSPHHTSKGCRGKSTVHARKQKQMGKRRSRKGSKRKCQEKRKTR